VASPRTFDGSEVHGKVSSVTKTLGTKTRRTFSILARSERQRERERGWGYVFCIGNSTIKATVAIRLPRCPFRHIHGEKERERVVL